jgi:hypothetical protein
MRGQIAEGDVDAVSTWRAMLCLALEDAWADERKR